MNYKKLTLNDRGYPDVLRNVHDKPKCLYTVGADLNELLERPAVAIVGTRQMTLYGNQVTVELARDLAEQGIVIISGLAFGVDALAHEAAIQAGGYAIAVLPGPLDNILPASNRYLAESILANGGSLVSEYAPGDIPGRQNFIARNRIVSGLAKAVIVVEAGEKSGALYTANFANQQSKHVFAVPGNLGNPHSKGTNNLILRNTAAIVTCAADVLFVLDIVAHETKPQQAKGRNPAEQTILDLIMKGVREGEALLHKSGLDIIKFNQTLGMLEINGKIRPLGANNWALT